MKSGAVEAGSVGALPLQAVIDNGGIAPIQVWVVFLCTFVALAEGIDLNLIPLLATSIRADWNVDAATFGVIFSAGPIGLIIGGLGVGWFSDRFGRRWALIGAMTVMTLGTVATAFVTDVPGLLICRIVTGIGFGGVVPVTSTMVSEFLPSRFRANVVALVILGQSAGGLVASLLMKTQLSTLPWQTVILYGSVLCVLTTLLLFAALPESPRYLLLKGGGGLRLASMLRRLRITEPLDAAAVGSDAEKGQLWDLFTNGRALGTLLLWLVFIGICAPVSFLTNWLANMATAAASNPDAGANTTAAYWAGGIVGGLVLPLFCIRFSVEKVLAGVILAAAVSCVALGPALRLGGWDALGLAFATGMFVSGAFYLMVPPAVRVYPTAIRSTGVGAAVAFGRFGNMLSPWLAGLMINAGQPPSIVFPLMAAPLLLSFVALLAFDRVTAGKKA